MWTPLQDPCQVAFYEEMNRESSAPGEDWQPMVRAVQYLQSRDYAPLLFAFTSLAHFQVTTAPSYAECERHHYVGITWAYAERLFYLRYFTKGWTSERAPDRDCTEADFPAVVDAFVRRLLLQSPQP